MTDNFLTKLNERLLMLVSTTWRFDEIQDVLSQCANVNVNVASQYNKGFTPLIIAAGLGSLPIVNLLLEYGAELLAIKVKSIRLLPAGAEPQRSSLLAM